MRDELNLIELVDRYLRSELDAKERAAFEDRMRQNAELRDLVSDQRDLHAGMARLALRPSVEKAYRNYKWGKWAPGIGGLLLVALLAVGGWMLMQNTELPSENSGTVTQSMDKPLALSDTTGTGLPALVMTIDPNQDTTLITPNGLVLDIPQGAFVDHDGRTITKPVRVTFLEAIDGVTIMKAGLSTMSGDMLLETGGMFYIDAQVDGKQMGIDPAKPLTVMVPSDQADPRMMLYEGVMTEEGVVDWRNPQPLPRTLIPVDISTLDFYPPGYLAKVAELGKDAMDKAYTDSLYFSFICPSPGSAGVFDDTDTLMNEIEPVRPLQFSGLGAAIPIEQALDTSTYFPSEPKKQRPIKPKCGIDPSKIEAIWNERFNGTNLATREFEERIREIHRTCDNAVLDLYVNNLDKNLSQLDSMAIRMGHGAFASFALRNDGRVDLPEHAAERLRNVYTEWSQRHAEVARKTHEQLLQKEAEEDLQAHARQVDHQMKEIERKSELFTKEYNANLRSAYEQLGYPDPDLPPAPPRAAFAARINAPGWWNVDKAVNQATIDRTSMSYTDVQTGKTATLTYTPLTISVDDRASYDELRVYLIPHDLNSYQRVTEQDGRFSERLNDLFRYDMVCIGRKDGQQYAASQWDVSGDAVQVQLEPASDEDLKEMLRPNFRRLEADVIEEARHLAWLELEAKRQQAKAVREEFRNVLMGVVFPCLGETVPGSGTGTIQIIGEQIDLPNTYIVNVVVRTKEVDEVLLTIYELPEKDLIYSERSQSPNWNGIKADGTQASGSIEIIAEGRDSQGNVVNATRTMELSSMY